jgi:ketosteroid isomerase-like protein
MKALNHKTDTRKYAVEFLESWNAHDVKKALAWMTEDCVWEFTVGSTPSGTTYEGVAAIGLAFEAIIRAVPDLQYKLLEFYAGDDHLVMEILVTGNNVETGAALRYQACDILVFRDLKVRAKRSYRKVVT